MNTDTRTARTASLTPAQVKVAVALAAGQTISEAAQDTGVSRTTIYSWLSNDTDFQENYDIIRRNLEDEMFDRVLELRSLALKKLRDILVDPDAPPAVQLRAALAILKDALNPAPAPPAKQPALNKTEQNLTPVTAADPGTPRNAPCPCGSGGKYKRCCGRHAPPVLHAA